MRAGLDGPSRTIIVEPVEAPVPPREQPVEPEPVTAPPEREEVEA